MSEVLPSSSNKCHASSNKCLTSSNKKLLELNLNSFLLLLVRHLLLLAWHLLLGAQLGSQIKVSGTPFTSSKKLLGWGPSLLVTRYQY